MKALLSVILMLFVVLMGGCASGAKIKIFSGQETIENQYAKFTPPVPNWYILDRDRPWIIQSDGKAQWINLHNDSYSGATYTIQFQTWPFKWKPYEGYFDKNAKYKMVLRDEDMKISEIDKEQGIGYKRQWVVYVQGMKCTAGVFSRSHGGMLKDIRNKDYSFTCGYYDKHEGKRLLTISYRYNYAGGSVRHEKDKQVTQSQLVTLEQAELGLKLAVKELVNSIRINNLDRERMEREGLMHYDKKYELSEY